MIQMRIGMAAMAAVMVALAGCSTATEVAPAPVVTSAAPSPTATQPSVAHQAVADLVAASGPMGPDAAVAARFVTTWWMAKTGGEVPVPFVVTLPKVTIPEQVKACDAWRGLNVDRIIRDHVGAEWGSTTGRWDNTAVRLELMSQMDRACIGG